ncbi:DUF4823 domain-containing protein [Methylobacillus gramineus]|uniref:DUF4823 domain-containing protein n=1 Tax=Methylobacillus gramineus TaxID=755169 RepID=UPI001CFF89E5|nr:DUF4823 domain-containing protein [Methylobacillus gramineus]MCB5185022.1 DUF4823 domain-containing protein [Methylobacillus gramineus]
MATLLTACADSHKLTRIGNPKDHPLSANESIYIAVPSDGMYEAKTYTGSGANTTQVIKTAFAHHLRRVQSGRIHQDFDVALQHAKTNNFTTLVYPTILHWEDRATEWSGIPDRLEVKIEVVNTADGSVIEEGLIKGKSGWATLGGDHPQDLLAKPVEEFVSSLFK